MVTFTTKRYLVSSVHAWFNVNVFCNDDHLLSKAVIHDSQFLKAYALLASIIKFFKCALYSNSQICETLFVLFHHFKLFLSLQGANDLAVLI